MEEYRSTLCWRCKNTNRYKCSWFDPKDPKPVEGWEAIRRDMFVDKRSVESYQVISCPNFDPEERCDAVPVSICAGVVMRNGKWVASITKKKKFHYLGRFDTMDEAIAARLEAEERLKNV